MEEMTQLRTLAARVGYVLVTFYKDLFGQLNIALEAIGHLIRPQPGASVPLGPPGAPLGLPWASLGPPWASPGPPWPPWAKGAPTCAPQGPPTHQALRGSQ